MYKSGSAPTWTGGKLLTSAGEFGYVSTPVQFRRSSARTSLEERFLTFQDRHKSGNTQQRPLGAVQHLSDATHTLNNVHKHDQALLHEWCIGMCLLYRGAQMPHDHHAHILTSSPRSLPMIALGSSHHLMV